MVFIFVQSALPSELSSKESGFIVDWIMRAFENVLPYDQETIVFAVRKGAHFTEYLVLGAALVPAVKEWREASGFRGAESALASWMIGTAYAVTDEFHQTFAPGRSCELRDMMIDSCGVLTGVLAASLAGWIMARRAMENEIPDD